MRFPRHCSDEDLIAYLDGELSGIRRYTTRTHMQRCWKCRVQLSELEQDVVLVTKAAGNAAYPNPERVARAERNFFAWAESIPEKRPAVPTRFGWAAACAGSFVLCVLAVSHLLPKRPTEIRRETPIAEQLIARAQEQEVTLERKPVRQSFRVVVEQSGKPREEQRLEIWSDPQTLQYKSRLESARGTLLHAVWKPDARRAYRYSVTSEQTVVPIAATHAPGAPLYTAVRRAANLRQFKAAFIEWLESRQWKALSFAADLRTFAAEDGSVLTSARSANDGEQGSLIVKVIRRLGEDLLEIAFVLDAKDYRPRIETLRIVRSGKVYQLSLIRSEVEEFRVASFEPRAPSSSLPKPPLAVPSMTLTPPPVFEAAAAPPNPFDLEVQVLFALHEAGACMGDPVEAVRQPDGAMLVRGVVSTAERRDKIRFSLARVEQPSRLTIDLKTISEAIQEVESSHIQRGASPAPRAPSFLRQIEKSFAGGKEQAKDLAARFSNDSVSAAEDLLAESEAIRRLLRRSAAGDSISPVSARLLTRMTQDHLRSMESHAERLYASVRPVLNPFVQNSDTVRPDPPSEGTVSLDEVLSLAHRTRDDVVALLVNGEPAEPQKLIARLLAELPDLSAKAQTVYASRVPPFPQAGERGLP